MGIYRDCSTPKRPGCFFLLWPLFARAPRHWFLENFLLSAPGVQSVFFLLRSVGRRDLSAGPEQKKKHHPGCLFFCSCPGERQGKEKPRWAPARGQSKKKNTTQGFFFLLRPRGKAGEGEAPLGAGTGPEQKVFFFLLWPRAGAQRGFSFPCRSRSRSKKKNTLGGVFFLLWPRAGAQRGFSFPCLSPGPQQKKQHPGWCFFFCSGPVPAPNGASPSRAFRRGRSKKNKYPGWCFFFLLLPRADGWRCLPLGGVVFVFLLRPRPDRGGVFFFAVAPPGRSLTHGGLGRFRQGPGGVFFFAAAPPGLFRQ